MPTDAELIFWIVCGVIAVLLMIAVHLPWNEYFNPKGDDPYRFCPKEEDM